MRTKAAILLGLFLLLAVSGMGAARYSQHHRTKIHKPAKQACAPKVSKPGSSGSAGGMKQGGNSMMQMMSMMQTMHPSIAVDDTAVYVVRGNQVLKLDKKCLQVIATCTLPAPGMQGSMGGMGSMGGGSSSMPGSPGGAGGQGMR